MPKWTSQAPSVLVEMDPTGRKHLRHQNDLTEVVREVFSDVEDGVEHRQIAPLNRTSFCQSLRA